MEQLSYWLIEEVAWFRNLREEDWLPFWAWPVLLLAFTLVKAGRGRVPPPGVRKAPPPNRPFRLEIVTWHIEDVQLAASV